MKTLLCWICCCATAHIQAQCPAPYISGVTNVTATTATLNWNLVGQALGYSAVYRMNGSSTWLSQGGPWGSSSNQAVWTSLTPGTVYQTGVQAQCAGLQVSTLSVTTFTTTCLAPASGTYTNLTPTSVTLQWTATGGAQHYRVEYKTAASSTWILAAASHNGISYTLNGLIPGTPYNYRVRTNCNSGAASTWLNASFTTPASCTSPGTVTISFPGIQQVQVNWSAVSGALYYQLEYKASTSGTWLLASSSIGGTQYTLNGLVPGIMYDYRLLSHCTGGGSSTWTNGQFIIPCPDPQSLAVSGIQSNAVSLNWNGGVGVTTYDIDYRTTPSGVWMQAALALAANTFTLNSLTPGTNYEVRLRANCSSNTSAWVTTTFTTLTACQQPTNLAVTNIQSNQADLSWTPVSGAITYRLEYRNVINLAWTLASASLSSTGFTLGGLNPSSTYEVRVRSQCSSGNSTYSYTTFSTPGIAPSCAVPQGLLPVNITATQTTLSWQAVPAAIQYTVRYRPVGGSVLWPFTTTTSGTSLLVQNLIPATLYEWQVETQCSSGISSGFSTSGFFSTLSCTQQPGTSLIQAINLGQVPCSGMALSHIAVNDAAQCFINNGTAPDNQPSPDIWYQFSLAQASLIRISHCQSVQPAMNTYIHLLDQNGLQIASNDDNGPVCSGNKASLQLTLGVGTYYIVSEGSGNHVGTIQTDVEILGACQSQLDMTLFLEGYYLGAGLMGPVMSIQAYSGLPIPHPLDVDDVIIELRDPLPPYQVIAVDTARLKTNGQVSCHFPGLNQPAYIVVKHRNSLITWSAQPVPFIAGGITTYDFHIAASQAYGANQVQVAPGLWALFSGDLNQDENMDLIDMSLLQNDVAAFLSGYQSSDLNGDGNVDLLDEPILQTHVSQFIYAIHP